MMRGRRGNMVLEAAMWMPVLFLLVSGVIQLGKITYLYYMLRKIEYDIAHSVSIESGVNFCPDASDTWVQEAIEFALTGTSDGSGPPLVENLRFEEQLPDAIDLFTRTMRAGHNIHSGLETIANETADPMKMEFKKLMEELALGSQVEPALHGLGKPVPLLDLKILGFILPKQVLYRMVRRYRRKLQKALPDTVDLLGIVLGTGLSLDQAVMRVREEMEYIYPELADEFATVVMQVRAGRERGTAFNQFVRRTGVAR